MTRKHWMLIATAIVLGGVSLYFNKDWFAKDTIQIFHRVRPVATTARRRANPNQPIPLIFGFDRQVKLTLVKVVPLCDLATNKYAHAVWHLVSDSNSVPIKDFPYGASIPGMHPNVKGATPEPIEPGVKYRLFIESPAFKGEHDFDTQPGT